MERDLRQNFGYPMRQSDEFWTQTKHNSIGEYVHILNKSSFVKEEALRQIDRFKTQTNKTFLRRQRMQCGAFLDAVSVYL